MHDDHSVVDTGDSYRLEMGKLMTLPMETVKGMEWWEANSMAKEVCRSLERTANEQGRICYTGGARYEPEQRERWVATKLVAVAWLGGMGIMGVAWTFKMIESSAGEANDRAAEMAQAATTALTGILY